MPKKKSSITLKQCHGPLNDVGRHCSDDGRHCIDGGRHCIDAFRYLDSSVRR